MSKRTSRWALAAFAVVGFIWGSNFLFMKWAAEEISPRQIALLRVAFGLLPVLALGLARREFRRWHLRHTVHFAVMGVLATSLYYVLYAAGTERLPSGLAGALSGAIPLFAFMVGAVALPTEPMTPRRVLGAFLGLAGVVMMARPWNVHGSVDPVGVLLMVTGSACVGASFVYTRRFITGLDIPPTALTTYQMALGLVALLPLTDLHGIGAIRGDHRALVGLVLGLGLVGTGLSYVIFYYLIAELGAATASAASYLPPVVALAIGWIGLGEPLRHADLAAVALILLGVAIIRAGARTYRAERGTQ
ncbi:MULTISPECIES: DMT family transporter [unclassified Nocardioides]|uniref:DMT family transporter n=1 Tax=unclassified Nocardioides TaxID=2615069 RepID=UPI000056F876|nr:MULTISPECIES: DMT family transporter [unclassified Nocardioides]ABL81369.1 protein of unknown function DUF6, transmembrane [Nocardioides sp. JS614]